MSADVDFRPLEGVSVVDFTVTLPGPYATWLLANLGATVVKLEPPDGDPCEPLVPDLYEALSWNKDTRRVDLKSSEGLAAAREVAATADIALEGWRPGVADRLGVGWPALSALNPGLIYCSLSGYGQTGDLTLQPGHDLNYQALAGALNLAGSHAHAPPPFFPIADLGASLFAVIGVLAALEERRHTGAGRYLDVAATDTVLALLAPAVSPRRDNAQFVPTLPHYGAFQASDGAWIALGVVYEDHFWNGLHTVLGLPDEYASLDMWQRAERGDELRMAIAEHMGRRPASEWLSAFAEADVPAGPVQTVQQAISGDHFLDRGVVRDFPDGRRIVSPIRPGPSRMTGEQP